jgi:hypothetical protein
MITGWIFDHDDTSLMEHCGQVVRISEKVQTLAQKPVILTVYFVVFLNPSRHI